MSHIDLRLHAFQGGPQVALQNDRTYLGMGHLHGLLSIAQEPPSKITLVSRCKKNTWTPLTEVKWLSLIMKLRMFMRLFRMVGRAPWNELWLISNIWRVLRLPTDFGIVPTMLLREKFISYDKFRFPMQLGIEPVTWLFICIIQTNSKSHTTKHQQCSSYAASLAKILISPTTVSTS